MATDRRNPPKASAAAIGTAYASKDISSRRRVLRLGGVGALSLSGLLQARLHADAAGVTAAAKIKACIFVFYYGGPSHLDTYDLKPDAPSAVRGEFQPIATTIPGLQICEHLPHMSKVMHHCALLRGMHHRNRLHDSASIETHTGRQAAQGDREEFAPIAQFFPCHGATLSALWRDRGLVVPHAALPFVFHNVVDVPCQGGGFLGSSVDPFRIAVDPEKRSYVAAELSPRDNLTSERMQSRLELLSGLQRSSKMTPGMAAGLEAFYGKAFQLLSASSVREALDLEQEPLKVRERYGIYTAGRQVDDHTTVAGPGEGYGSHMRGQNLLLARRLVEAGIPFVNVYDYKQQGKNWDSHGQNFELHKRDLLPPADKALSALISDLSERGLLESTLIVATGEFGRTPTINANAGRDHWPDCYTVLLAGGGVQGGAIHGASDKIGAYPARDPVTPADLAATIYWRFGFEPATQILDRTSRPWHVADGKPIREIFAT